jgi:hypothetical protein
MMSLPSNVTPFFIVGAQRSGTTLLRLMLNCHTRLCVPFESVFITEFFHRLSEFKELAEPTNCRRLLNEIATHRFVLKGELLPDPEAVLAQSPQTYAELVDAIFSVLAHREQKVRWGDKTPSYVTEIDTLWQLFPGAKFIHLVRDGRDVALSLRRVAWGNKHLPRAAEDWRRKTELAHKMGAMIPENFFEVRYEDLIQNTGQVLKSICEFLSEPYEAAMLSYHERAREFMPENSLQWHHTSVSPIDANKVYEWKGLMPNTDRAIFESIAGSSLKLFGYETEDRPATLATRVRKLRYHLGC